jgi:hypothetical protein
MTGTIFVELVLLPIKLLALVGVLGFIVYCIGYKAYQGFTLYCIGYNTHEGTK